MSLNLTHNPRITGLLVIEVRDGNPNGDPDQDSDPRTRETDGRGVISPVSFKRKLRDLVDDKDGPVWQSLRGSRNDSDFDILEARRHLRPDINKILKEDFEGFKRRFWDARLFGNTFLEKEGGNTIRAGVAHFGLGTSVAPVNIERRTLTKMAPAQEDKGKGMAPLGDRRVEHGVYTMPFFVNPSAAGKTGCTADDVQLFLDLIPHAYRNTMSVARTGVELRHAWCVVHHSPLGDCSDFAIIDALTPSKKEAPDKASKAWGEYLVPDKIGVLEAKVASFDDLVAG